LADEATTKRLYDYIRLRPQGVIATVTPDGRPQAALLDIAVSPDLKIVFETTDQTRKFANLRADPRVALVIGGMGEETLQYDGVVERLSERETEQARAHYISVFPQKFTHQNWPGNYYFQVRPLWVRFSNYHRPRKVEEFRFANEDSALAHAGWWRRLMHTPSSRQRN